MLDTDRAGAERRYREAVRLDPELKEAWFDLGLIAKWERRWDDAYDWNLRAAELVGEEAEEPAWWNLGIAATALCRWDTARRAWAAFGVPIPPGAGAIEGDFGFGPVRLNPDDEGEVVWGHRIDPARMRITSIPFPQSGHRWADVVLHDGAPNGYRDLGGQPRPVFDELMRWQASDVPTVQASVRADSDDAVDALLDAVRAAGYEGEDWTRNVRVLCRQCSEGAVHAEHAQASLANGGEHLVGVAAPLPVADELVRRWADAPGRELHDIEQVL